MGVARRVHVVAQEQRGCGRGFPESSSTLIVEGILGSSVQFRCSVVSYCLWPHGLQHARLPCPSPTPGACSNSCPSSRWYLGRAHIKLWHWVQIPELSLRDLDERHKLADSHPSSFQIHRPSHFCSNQCLFFRIFLIPARPFQRGSLLLIF